ncbi:RNA-directed DNA polymerase [Abeliophyllum distichum]|uniref:RNA-directed DNA polymerase n=1 Tax=Abeliophyllum distichum TaxID=126358 RepID=A0ABD1SZE1_9LAMI
MTNHHAPAIPVPTSDWLCTSSWLVPDEHCYAGVTIRAARLQPGDVVPALIPLLQPLRDLAKMRTPLQKKLKKDHKWNWTKDDSNYVRKIKAKLKNLPPLYHPYKDDKMIIETDASHEFWGAALKAVTDENEEKLCNYASGTFNTAEKNYHINEKEILAMRKGYYKI